MPQFDQQLRLHVTGCPNGCGQHWIADIGIEGKKIKHEGKLVDAYYFCLGGSVGQHAGIARPVGYRTPATLVPEAIERLLRKYLVTREPDENLRAWFARHTNDELRALSCRRSCLPGRARSADRPRAARGGETEATMNLAADFSETRWPARPAGGCRERCAGEDLDTLLKTGRAATRDRAGGEGGDSRHWPTRTSSLWIERAVRARGSGRQLHCHCGDGQSRGECDCLSRVALSAGSW